MPLFGRQVILEIGQPGELGKRFLEMRVSFRVQMSRSSNPNTCTIEAYNLARSTISEAQRPGAVVRLLAGYDVPRLLFQGTAVKDGVWSKQQGPDRILHFEGQDGGAAIASARVDVTFTTPTTLSQVLAVVQTQLGLPAGVLRITDDIQFPQGIALSGPARDVLDRIAAIQGTGGDWFIRDGALQIVGPDGETGELSVEFSVANGNLIGSPSPKDSGIEVTGLLEPSVRPGRRFVVRSRDFDGIYVAGDVAFQGDSGWDRPFYTIVTGKRAA